MPEQVAPFVLYYFVALPDLHAGYRPGPGGGGDYPSGGGSSGGGGDYPGGGGDWPGGGGDWPGGGSGEIPGLPDGYDIPDGSGWLARGGAGRSGGGYRPDQKKGGSPGWRWRTGALGHSGNGALGVR